MKKQAWKILTLVVMTAVLMSLAVTALAAPQDEKNSFSFTRKGTVDGTTTYSRAVPLLTDAVTMTIRVNNNHTATNGAEQLVDELRFKTWSTVPGATYEQELNAKKGTSSAVYNLTDIPADSYTVSVKGYEKTANVPFYISVTGTYKIGLNVYKWTMDVGDSINLVGYYCADLNQVWSSSKPDVATVDKDGKVTAKAPGTAKITLAAGGQTVSMTVVVCSYSLNDQTLLVNETAKLKFSDPAKQIDSIAWSSSDPTVAAVDANGKVTGKKIGNATITATITMKDSSTKTVTCKITVAKEKNATSTGKGSLGKMQIQTGNWGKLHLRKAADRKSQSLGLYPSGTIVNVTSNDGTWAKVKIGTKTGFMMTQYLTLIPEEKTDDDEDAEETEESTEEEEAEAPKDDGTPKAGDVMKVKSSISFVYMRKTPGSATVVAKIPGGAKVTILSWGTWAKVKYDGQEGYVSSSRLTK